MLMCNSVSVTMGWKEEAVLWLHLHGDGIPGLFGVKCDAHSRRGCEEVHSFRGAQRHESRCPRDSCNKALSGLKSGFRNNIIK